jgi:hypothetical protein
MKFLCVACDQPMKLESVDRTDGGSLSVLYACPTCSQRTAMLTNPWETEMVQSLGVRIGPAAAGGALREGAEGARAAEGGAGVEAPGTAAGSRCPFSGVVREMEAEAAQPAQPAGPVWTAEALARLEGIPDFVRPMARQGIEHYAKSSGYAEIDERVLDEARARFGM